MAAADWEAIKENARPLRTGYKMSSLASLLASPPAVSKLVEQQRGFEAAVAVNGGSDPLTVWREYIAWAELNSAATDVAIDTTNLLERCVVQFRQFPEYKNDARYVKIALKYASLIADPFEIYAFLEEWGIGSTSALRYMFWAEAFERVRKFAQAEEVYQLGLSRLESVTHPLIFFLYFFFT
jgi:hypothetical protein